MTTTDTTCTVCHGYASFDYPCCYCSPRKTEVVATAQTSSWRNGGSAASRATAERFAEQDGDMLTDTAARRAAIRMALRPTGGALADRIGTTHDLEGEAQRAARNVTTRWDG